MINISKSQEKKISLTYYFLLFFIIFLKATNYSKISPNSTKSFKFYHEFLDDELELTKIIAAKITAALFTKGLYKTESRG